MHELRIAVVDTNIITRKGTEVLIKQSDLPVRCVSTLAHTAAFQQMQESSETDILLLDDTVMTPTQIERTLAALAESHPNLKTIIISTRLTVAYIQRVMRSGVLGYVSCSDDPEHAIISAIRAVNRGLVYLSPKASECLTTTERLIATGSLSTTDLNVLKAMVAGFTVQQIALKLTVSERTIYRARARLRDVLNVTTNEQIIDAAREQGLLEEA